MPTGRPSWQVSYSLLFPGRGPAHVSTKTMVRTIDRLAEQGRDSGVFFEEALRHSRIVNALMSGVPVPMIQKQVGHKRP